MTTDLKSRFTTDGFVCPLRVLTPDEAMYYRGKYDDYVRRYGTTGEVGVRRIRGNRLFRLHVVASWAARLVRHPALIRAVSEVSV
jgi:non-heme Fe2+,alpha-ketoglutarate-dependent halogenase